MSWPRASTGWKCGPEFRIHNSYEVTASKSSPRSRFNCAQRRMENRNHSELASSSAKFGSADMLAERRQRARRSPVMQGQRRHRQRRQGQSTIRGGQCRSWARPFQFCNASSLSNTINPPCTLAKRQAHGGASRSASFLFLAGIKSCTGRRLSPKSLEPRRIGRGVAHGVLNIPVSEVILNQARVRALIGQSEAAGMAQHVRIRGNR